jgi:hypothetical protein
MRLSDGIVVAQTWYAGNARATARTRGRDGEADNRKRRENVSKALIEGAGHWARRSWDYAGKHMESRVCLGCMYTPEDAMPFVRTHRRGRMTSDPGRRFAVLALPWAVIGCKSSKCVQFLANYARPVDEL